MKSFSRVMLFVAAVFVVVLLSACGKTEQYSVRDFANVEITGYSDHGRVAVEVDDSAIALIYADGTKDKATAERFGESFVFEYEGKDDDYYYFCNGDVVTVNVTYDEELASALGISFEDSSFDITVNGLEDKTEVSPFDGLSVTFSGVSPYGSVQIDKSNCLQYVKDNVTFTCSSYDLSNGDKIIVTAEFNSEIAERNGYIFTETEKRYTVVGLSKYASSLSSVSYGTTTALMHRMAEEYIEGTDYGYKSMDWGFGDDSDTDTDTDSDIDLDEYSQESEEYYNEDYADEYAGSDEESTDDEDTDSSIDGDSARNDLMIADFSVTYEYEPLTCYYSLNTLQYSDNIFSAVYKVTATFICTNANGAGYIEKGDILFGELYVVTSLAGGSVDVKNNLYYDDTVLSNYYSYSCRGYRTTEELEEEINGDATYTVEELEYTEDQQTYNEYTKTSNSVTTIVGSDTDTDTDTDTNTNANTDYDIVSETSSATASDATSSTNEETVTVYY